MKNKEAEAACVLGERENKAEQPFLNPLVI